MVLDSLYSSSVGTVPQIGLKNLFEIIQALALDTPSTQGCRR